MTPDITATAPTVINAFSQTGGILGLIVLALLVFIGLVTWLGWGFLNALIKNHESRMDNQEQRHQRDRDTSNQQWQQVTREITADMKTVLDNISRVQTGALTTLERIDRGVEKIQRKRAA